MPDQPYPAPHEVLTGAARPQQPGPIRRALEWTADKLLSPKGGER